MHDDRHIHKQYWVIVVDSRENSRLSYRYRQFLYVSKSCVSSPINETKSHTKSTHCPFSPFLLSLLSSTAILLNLFSKPHKYCTTRIALKSQQYPHLLSFHHCTSDILHGTQYYHSVRSSKSERWKSPSNENMDICTYSHLGINPFQAFTVLLNQASVIYGYELLTSGKS